MSFKQTIISHIVLLCICIVIFAIAIFRRIRHLKKDTDTRYYAYHEENKLSILYRKLVKIVIFRRYLENIKNKYEIVSPEDEEILRVKTMKLSLLNWGISILIVVASFWMFPSVLMAITVSITLVIFNSYRIYLSVAKENLRLLFSFNDYLGEIRHSFYTYKSVEDALFNSLLYAKAPLSHHIQMIYDVLTSEDIESAASTYRSMAPNKYMSMFLSICILVQTYGDTGKDGESLFEKNILALKEDVCEEIDNRDKLLYRLAGYVPLAVLPMILLQPIKTWGTSILDNLDNFYNGFMGIFLTTIIIVSSVIAYNLLVEIKQIRLRKLKEHTFLQRISKIPIIKNVLDIYEYKKYSHTLKINESLRLTGDSLSVKQFLVKKFLFALCTFVVCCCLSIYSHYSSRSMLVHNVENFITDTGSTSEEQKTVIRDAVSSITLRNASNYKITKEDILNDLIENYTIYNYTVMYATADEIFNRVQSYQNEFFHWYELIFCIVLSIMAYFVPSLQLAYKKHLVQMDMEDEIVQFQSIILMMKDIKRINVLDILERLEEYSNIFKKSIGECIDNFSHGDIEALEKLKDTEKFPMFQHLVDGMIICDKIGIDKAFDDLWEERENNQKKRRFDNEKLIMKKELNSKVIAWIPFILILALYLIIPFVTESVYGYMENQTTINSSYNNID